MRLLLFLILLFPLLELGVLIQVGSRIGVLPVLLLVIAGVVLGVLCLRLAGFATAWRTRERLARGELPDREMFDGMLMAVSGMLLMFPGLVSDVLGLLLLLPASRGWLLARLRGRMKAQMYSASGFTAGPDGPRRDADLIEGEYERHDR